MIMILEEKKNEIKIGIIVVLYNCSDLNIDSNQIPDNSLLIAVDNTPHQNLNMNINDNLIYIPLGENRGIADAQNIGIKEAQNSGCTHIIFFDQDSVIPEGYIEKIVNEYERIKQQQPNLFLLGPSIYNGRNGVEYKSKIHTDTPTNYDFIPRREIISSGSCVDINKIQQIGTLDSSLFIDLVDFEWCWRANAKGFQSGITPKVTITHFVGQQEYYFLKQLIIISSPIRYFYQTRNYLWLLRRSYVPISWKINNGIKRIFFPITFPFKVKQWREIYHNIINGFIAGLKFKK